MAAEAKLSHTAAMILHSISAGSIYGFSVMEKPACLVGRSILPCGGSSATILSAPSGRSRPWLTRSFVLHGSTTT